jgi:predicted  nucleic acid-binding Zn-ribbon protein
MKEPIPISKKKQKRIESLKNRIELLDWEIESLDTQKRNLENELFYLENPECVNNPKPKLTNETTNS